jgi:hypothetical protein
VSQGRILVASDEPNARRALRITLVAKPYEVAEDEGAETALRL